MTAFLNLAPDVKSEANGIGALGRQIETALSSPAVSPAMLENGRRDLEAVISRATALLDRLPS